MRVLVALALALAFAAIPTARPGTPLPGECAVPVAALPVPAEESHDAGCAGIRPGARMDAPSGCTFNFVFTGAGGSRYVGTAGHCVDAVGQRVSAAGVGPFGSVAFLVNEGQGMDFALVRVDPDKESLVSPALCHWGGPTGPDPESAGFGEPVRQFGHGLLLGATPTTQPREGSLVVYEEALWRAAMPVTGGDSGSPAVFADGRALGIVTHLSVTFSYPDHPEAALSTSTGTRLAHAVSLAEAALGETLTLGTAPLAS